MAYDSASATEQAGQAWKRAKLAAQQRRTALNVGYGLNSDGSMDNSDVGHLGSIYQGNLDSVMGMEGAELQDRRRGFGGSGGLAGKHQAAADNVGQQRQAVNLRDANTQLGQNTQEGLAADQQYEDDKTNIDKAARWDAAQTIVDNPISVDQGGLTQTKFAPIQQTAKQIAVSTAQKKAIKKNPRIAQTARNRY